MVVDTEGKPFPYTDVGEPDSFIGQNAPPLPTSLVSEVQTSPLPAAASETKSRLPFSSSLPSTTLLAPSLQAASDSDLKPQLAFSSSQSSTFSLPIVSEVHSLRQSVTESDQKPWASLPINHPPKPSPLISEVKPTLQAASERGPQLQVPFSSSQLPTSSLTSASEQKPTTFSYFSNQPSTNDPFSQPFPAAPPLHIQPPTGFAPPPFSSPSYTPQTGQSPAATDKSLFLSSISPALLPGPTHPSPSPSPPSFQTGPSLTQPDLHPSPSATPPVQTSYSPAPPLLNTSSRQVPLPVATVAPTAGGSNTYRLGGQRRLQYAQPPGLSVTTPVPKEISPTSSAPVTGYLPTSYSSPSLSSSAYASTPLVVPSQGSVMAATMTSVPTVSAGGPASAYQTAASSPEPAVIPPSFSNLTQGQPIYRKVYHHWFRKKEVETKVIWEPFSMVDSLALEEAFNSPEISADTTVATDGGRYDVLIQQRQRKAVYWEEKPTEVRRCSWFYKGATDSRYVPYEESVAAKLEEEFEIAFKSDEWHRRVEFPNGESVMFHGPNVMVHFPQATSPDVWGNTPQVPTRPRVVKRGVDEFDIDEGEPSKVDHLLFLVHGVGSACDLKFRSVEEVVDDFRSLSLQLVQSHFRTAVEQAQVNRIEVLPVSWHSTLHGEDTGIDRKLKAITLHSIPRLRHFTNDTLLDILFYTSPVFCQTIMHTVGREINRLYELFRSRHPSFTGGVSLGGHSLGSLILFDLLCHQKPPVTPGSPQPDSREGSLEPISLDEDSKDTLSPMSSIKIPPPHLRKLSHRVSYVMGNAGTGQPYITYPQLNFHPSAFFAMGSPIGMFVTVRGIDTLGEDFKLPTCPSFFNIFHPFDPVAYRIEALINQDLVSLKPVMVPHHKGRKRMHLELKETMARVGADLKQKLLDSVRSTWNTVYQLAMFHRADGQALEQEVDKVLEEQLKQQETESNQSAEEPDLDVHVGQLNGGRRVDYVLQEAPLESFNEYLFALGSHVCYWESEDTMLMILKEIYSAMGISADSNVPQSNSSYEKVASSSSYSQPYQDSLVLTGPSMSSFVGDESHHSTRTLPSYSQSPVPSSSQPILGMDPTAPPSENKHLGPPPVAGFVRK
ncbi:phospholipase DDHD2 isoform X2 [Anabrus simplex]|uniref:phospholipase DDHD2 isoform X2 n=1 Tax=Anabrus simplex TaxID=316456 RepID=UPI0035A3CFE6